MWMQIPPTLALDLKLQTVLIWNVSRQKRTWSHQTWRMGGNVPYFIQQGERDPLKLQVPASTLNRRSLWRFCGWNTKIARLWGTRGPLSPARSGPALPLPLPPCLQRWSCTLVYLWRQGIRKEVLSKMQIKAHLNPYNHLFAYVAPVTMHLSVLYLRLHCALPCRKVHVKAYSGNEP